MLDTFSLVKEFTADISRGDVSFPTFAAATFRIQEALGDPDIDVGRLATIVASEPLLPARLIKLANAPIHGTGNAPVTDVKAAVMRLGFSAVQAAAYAFALEQLTQMKEYVRVARHARLVLAHSIDVAALAHVMAHRLTRIPPEQALFAGLVHDIGSFYLLARLASRVDLPPDSPEFQALVADWHTAFGHQILVSLR
ncbi:MAG: HDOD domain-containing protein, partial [Proteobacteria bacterium]|nr:HDOD domain-containing protein [Pseudomonadota bacterium]